MSHPVLILGSEPRVVVTIARSLSARGILTDVAGFGGAAPNPRSRAIRRFYRLPDPLAAPDAFLRAIQQAIRDERYDMLIPASDTALTSAARYEDVLRPLLHLACPPADVVDVVLDKAKTLSAARRCGVPVPTEHLLNNWDDVESRVPAVRFPLIAKPANKSQDSAFKTMVLHSPEALRAAFQRDQMFGSRNLIQEYCPGVGIGVEILMHDGRVLAVFQHQRLKETPFRGGVSVLAVSESPDPRFTDPASRLLREIGWDGVAMVEFRYEPQTGRTALMEVNGRFWGSLALSRAAGVDFPYYEWQRAHGVQPSVPASYHSGVRMRWTAGELLRIESLLRSSATETTGRPPFGRELLRIASDFRPGTRDALWSHTDPLPACQELAYTALSFSRSGLKALVRRLVPDALMNRITVGRRLGGRAARIYLQGQFARALSLRRDQWLKPAGPVRFVLFVCHGNIIRSALSAALFQKAIAPTTGVKVDSAGVAAISGTAADPRAVSLASELGIALGEHRAKPLSESLIRAADVIFVMDFLNEARLLSDYPHVRKRLFLLGSCAPEPSSEALEIVDPYEGDMEHMRASVIRIQACVNRLAEDLGVATPG